MSMHSYAVPAPTFFTQNTCFQTLQSCSRIPPPLYVWNSELFSSWRQWSEVFFSKSLKPSRDSCMCTGARTHATSQAPALMKCANFLRLKHIFMQPSCFLRALNNSSTSFLPKRCQFFTKRGTTCVNERVYVLRRTCESLVNLCLAGVPF
jgi:hypothetical protein